VSGAHTRSFCQAAAERGILFAPGDCFDVPSHFRLGFAASGDNFGSARPYGRVREELVRDGHSLNGGCLVPSSRSLRAYGLKPSALSLRPS
jgi:hypothetical protein